jgi:thioredoxin reductase (NADPH)
MIYDVIIIGGGPAGATAAIYAARAKLSAAVIYKNYGALEQAERVDNFYGFTKISGKALVEKGLRQARKAGAKTIRGEAVGIRKAENLIIVETSDASYEGRTVLLAAGASRSVPKIHGLTELEGRGVSYCAVCDAFFYRGKNVAVLGNGAYALHEVEDLLPTAESVTLLTNGEEPCVAFPEAVKIRKEKIQEIIGGESAQTFGISKRIFQGVLFENGESLPFAGLFIAVGIAGGTELARKIGAVIDGSVKTDSGMRTSVEGIWAAGDCTGGLKQIVKAAHEGAEAAINIKNFLRTIYVDKQ